MTILFTNSNGDTVEYDVVGCRRVPFGKVELELKHDEEELGASVQGDLADDIWLLWENDHADTRNGA